MGLNPVEFEAEQHVGVLLKAVDLDEWAIV
jgi:hypothetical protein